MTTDEDLLEDYAIRIEPLLPLAKRAYGSRDRQSPEHDASREYTRLLKEFHEQEGSLIEMAKRLNVTYAGLRRRVTTADVSPMPSRGRKHFSDDEYFVAVMQIKVAKLKHTEAYHRAIKRYYDKGYSMARIARGLGISGPGPLYYGINRERIRDAEG